MRLWVLRAAIQAAVHRARIPLVRLRSSSWSDEDHCHFCYAVRILEPNDFHGVCPLARTGRRFDAEYEDECDKCPYFGGVSFQCVDGKRQALFWK